MMPTCHTFRFHCGPVILISTLVFLAACDRTAPIMASTKSTQEGNPSAQTASSYTQFPDIPIPSGAKINIEKTLIFGSKPWFGQLSLSTSANADTLFDFYRNNLPQYNWQEITSVRAPISILTYDNEDRVMSIAIAGSTLRGSDITLTVSPKGTASPSSKDSLMPAPVIKP